MKTISATVATRTLLDSTSRTRRPASRSDVRGSVSPGFPAASLTKLVPLLLDPTPSKVTEGRAKCQMFRLLPPARARGEHALGDAGLGETAVAVGGAAGEDGQRDPLPVALEQ